MKDKCTADISKIHAEAEGLYILYNLFGRGRIDEINFCLMHMRGELPEYIRRVVAQEEIKFKVIEEPKRKKRKGVEE